MTDLQIILSIHLTLYVIGFVMCFIHHVYFTVEDFFELLLFILLPFSGLLLIIIIIKELYLTNNFLIKSKNKIKDKWTKFLKTKLK